MRPYRLTPAARTSLRDIARWTRDRFGLRQAADYREALIATFARIADGTAASRSLRETLAPNAPVDLRVVRSGRHLVLFRERGEVVEITDVLHGAMDVPGRVRE